MTDALHDLVFIAAALPALAVARRYRRLPSVIPISTHPNGAPVAHGPRWLVAVPPALIAVLLPLAAAALHAGGAHGLRSESGIAAIYALLIEVGLFAALVLGLEAEVAVGSLRRFPSLVQYAAVALLAATFAIALVRA